MTLCPSTRFVDGSIPVLTHDPLLLIVLLRYEQDPDRKILVLLGETGGIEEHRVIGPVKKGNLLSSGPLVPTTEWSSFTLVPWRSSDAETTDGKNRAMRGAWLCSLWIQRKNGIPLPSAQVGSRLGLIRKPAALILTISDERGQELLYADMRTSDVVKEDIGVLLMKRKHTCATVLRSNWFRGQL
ncbi:hypothetical protein JOM56_011063 [Amanita muscaria]